MTSRSKKGCGTYQAFSEREIKKTGASARTNKMRTKSVMYFAQHWHNTKYNTAVSSSKCMN
eukprot:12425138-Ditylum_brightwellii.AAC.1